MTSGRTVAVTVESRCAASPDRAFDVIVPISLPTVFTGWGPFPAVIGVADQTGPWDEPGRERTPLLSDGSRARERLTEYTPRSSFAYELSEFTGSLARLVTGIRGEWTFTPDGKGSMVRWTYAFEPLPGRGLLLRAVVAPLWRRYARQALSLCIAQVEANRQSPRVA